VANARTLAVSGEVDADTAGTVNLAGHR